MEDKDPIQPADAGPEQAGGDESPLDESSGPADAGGDDGGMGGGDGEPGTGGMGMPNPAG